MLTADALRAAFGAGGTVSQIARQAGVDRSTVRRTMRRHDITNPRADWGRRPVLLDDPDWLRRRYVDELRSQQDIAEEVDAAAQTVRRALERHGIERPAGIARRVDVDPVWLKQMYAVERLSLAEIARQGGVNYSTIVRRLHEYGIPKRPPIPQPPRERPKTDRPGGLDPVWLRRRYLEERATMAQLGREGRRQRDDGLPGTRLPWSTESQIDLLPRWWPRLSIGTYAIGDLREIERLRSAHLLSGLGSGHHGAGP